MMIVRTRHLFGVAVLAAALPASASGSGFPIAATAQPESTAAVAFDGTNFLVPVQESNSPSSGSTTVAKLVSPSGAVLASVTVPRSGDPPRIAFDGTNYLLVWAEPSNPSGRPIYGQLVSTQGSLVGSQFLVSQSLTVREVDGVAFDGTNFLVVWTDLRRVVNPPQPGDRDVYGRFVSIAGVPVGIDFEIDDGAGVEGTLAFGGSNYLVVWNEDFANTEIRGRFVTPAGVLQSAFTANGSSAASDNPSGVAFDGTNFLVVWGDDVGGSKSAEWDLFGQIVSPAATLVGSPIPIVTAPDFQFLPYIAFDGINYLVTWTDLSNDGNHNFVCDPGEGTCADVYGQFLSPSGTLVGTNFAVTTDPDNQGQSPVAYGGGKYLVAWNDRFLTPSADVFGIFLLSDPIFIDGFEASPIAP